MSFISKFLGQNRSDSPDPPEPGPNTLYRPGDIIGAGYYVQQVKVGGMGEVYLCHSKAGDTFIPTALKTFQSQYAFDQHTRELFKHELATWVALGEHINIVRCSGIVEDPSRPFMDLHRVQPGKGKSVDLSHWLREGPLDIHTTLNFLIGVCEGLIHANQKIPGIVHRDLKPGNILIEYGSIPKITDFGLVAIVQKAGMTLTPSVLDSSNHHSMIGSGGVVGTRAYMPPEQWRAETVDARADIYALGCILYELLVGIPPYIVDARGKDEAQFSAEYRWLHEHADLPTLPEHMPMAKHLNRVIACCMAKEQHNRPASVEELHQALQWIYQQHTGSRPTPFQVDEKPMTATDICKRAMNHRFVGRYEEAMADVNQALQMEPSPFFYNERGILYTELQQYDLALADFAQAIETSSGKLTDPFINRTIALRILGRYEEALADYTHALEIDPDDFDAYRGRGGIHSDMKNYQAALADLTRSLELAPRQAATHYNLGGAYFGLGRYQEALHYYQQAIDIDPAYIDAYINRAMTHAALYEYAPQAVAEAVANLQHISALAPDDPAIYRSIGLLYYQMQDFHTALGFLDQAIPLGDETAQQLAAAIRQELAQGLVPLPATPASSAAPTTVQRPDSATVALAQKRIEQGNKLLEEDRYDRALDEFMTAIRIDPTDPDAFVKAGALLANRDDVHKAMFAFEEAAQLGHPYAADNAARLHEQIARGDFPTPDYVTTESSPPPEAIFAFEKAYYYRVTGRPEQALEEYSRAIEILPTFWAARNNRGHIYRSLERYQEALDDFNHVLQSVPNDAMNYVQRGNVYRDLGKDTAALADYQQALRLDPTSVSPYFARSNLYYRRRKYKKALKEDEQAIKLQPEDPLGYMNRGMCYWRLKKHRQAEQDFARAYDLGKWDDSEFYRTRGNFYLDLGRPIDAMADYEILVDREPEDATAMCQLGYIYKELNMLEFALAIFNRAITTAPRYAWAWYQRGKLLAETGHFEDALEDLQRAVEIAPKFGEAYRFMGHAYREMGVYTRALHYYEEAARCGDEIGANEAANIRRMF